METYIINRIKNDPNLYRYLRENSSWYKYLNRDSKNIKYLENEMKEKYKLTTSDKIENLSRNINLISTFFDVLK
ncbi:MAG: YlbE-like family protein [Bacilli bacterium]|nr:YlbE-like family protein [Bacilli bacterium]